MSSLDLLPSLSMVLWKRRMGECIKSVISLWCAPRGFPPKQVTTHLKPLAFFGAFIDAIGGGGLGSIAGSTLLARVSPFRETVGTVDRVEFL